VLDGHRSAGTGIPTVMGHFAVFNRWTEIGSLFEGQFMERFAPGAFTRTLVEDLAGLKVLFQHGRDPYVGNKPLGPTDTGREDGYGAFYRVPLLDTATPVIWCRASRVASTGPASGSKK
jgi:phage head maturation protease